MTERLQVDGTLLYSIRQINHLLAEQKLAIYRQLVPADILAGHDIASANLARLQEKELVEVNCAAGTGFVEIALRHQPDARDPLLYVQLADTVSGQLEVLLFVVNDPTAERFDVDRDWEGQRTKFGTLSRNIPEETQAMEAGLAPGQVRRGLRLTKTLIPMFEEFVGAMGHDRFFIEPLAYHNATLFERYGFSYMMGHAKMEWIHTEFSPGGELDQRLDGSTPFRQPGAGQTIRGRSWAIHDGILDETWGGVRMYKRVGRHAGLCTAPGIKY